MRFLAFVLIAICCAGYWVFKDATSAPVPSAKTSRAPASIPEPLPAEALNSAELSAGMEKVLANESVPSAPALAAPEETPESAEERYVSALNSELNVTAKALGHYEAALRNAEVNGDQSAIAHIGGAIQRSRQRLAQIEYELEERNNERR